MGRIGTVSGSIPKLRAAATEVAVLHINNWVERGLPRNVISSIISRIQTDNARGERKDFLRIVREERVAGKLLDLLLSVPALEVEIDGIDPKTFKRALCKITGDIQKLGGDIIQDLCSITISKNQTLGEDDHFNVRYYYTVRDFPF